MNIFDDEILKNLKIYCPANIITKYSHKHKIPSDWIRFYYYKNKQQQTATMDDIAFDYEVSSTLNYKKNVFYKMTTMSSEDNYFDYFFKLKSDLPKCVVKKSNRYGRTNKQKILKKQSWFNPDKNPPEMSPDGKYICRFA